MVRSDQDGRKSFRQRKPDGNGGWTWKTKECRRVLYRLPEVIKAVENGDTIFFCEGEKDTDNLFRVGLVATTIAGGALKNDSRWNAEYSEILGASKEVVVLPDNDEPGRKHAEIVASKIASRTCSVRVVRIPGLKDKGDVSDWIAAGGTTEQLLDIVDSEPLWRGDGDRTQEPRDISEVLSPPTPPNSIEWVPFPVGAFPSPLREFISVSASVLGCDASFLALPLLSLLAGAIGNSRVIQLKPGWDCPSVIWTAIVGNSGCGKSPALKHVLRFATDLEAKYQVENQMNQEDFDREMEEYERDLAERKRRNPADPLPVKPEPANPKRFAVRNITIEALALRLLSNPKGLFMGVDELDQWFESFTRYKNGGGSDRSQWLEMHGAAPVQVDRKTGDIPSIFIPRAAVSVCGGIQPTIMARTMGDGNRESGLLARILLACPPAHVPRWTEHSVPVDLEHRVQIVFRRLIGLPLSLDENGRPSPQRIPLSTEAKPVWVEFFDQHADEQVNLSGDLSAMWSKILGYVPRFALFFHSVRRAAGPQSCRDPEEIDCHSMRAAIELGAWFANEAERLYQIFNESAEGRDRRELVEWIEAKGGQVTVRDLNRGPRKYRHIDSAETALSDLVKLGVGDWEDVPPKEGGGRPTRRFLLRCGDRTF